MSWRLCRWMVLVNVGPIDFFFQAEDGIRDYKVTGVQTWARPISSSEFGSPRQRFRALARGSGLGIQGLLDRTFEQGLSKNAGPVLGLARGGLELRHRQVEAAMSALLGEAPRELGLLLERA